MLTHTHICIPYYILIDTHACVACILINRAQTQRSAPAPAPTTATAIGRLGGTWPCYKAATDCFFFQSPHSCPALPYPLYHPAPVSGPFMLAFIYLLAAIAFSIFRLQIGKVQTQQRTHVAESGSIEMATDRSQSLLPSQTVVQRGKRGRVVRQTGHAAYAAAQKLQINPTTNAAKFN